MRLRNKGGQIYVDQIGLDQPVIFPGSMDRQTIARAVMDRFGDQIRTRKARDQELRTMPPEQKFAIGAGHTGEMLWDFMQKPRFGTGSPEQMAEYDQRAQDRQAAAVEMPQYGDAFGYGQMLPYMAPPAGAVSRPIQGLMARLGLPKAGEAVGRSVVADTAGQGAILGAASDEGTAAEGAAYGAGGGFLGKALSRALRPADTAIDPHLGQMADTGEKLGYQLLPSQRTGSKRLEQFEDAMESNFFSGGGALRVAEANQANSNRIVAESLGFRDKVHNKVTPDMLDQVSNRFNKQFEDLTTGSAVRLGDDFVDVLADLEASNVGWVRNKSLKKVIDRALDDAATNGGWVSGDQYQRISSELVADIRANYKMGGNVRYGQKIQVLKEALDDAAEFSLPADQAKRFKDVRADYKTYANLMKNQVINEDTGDVSLRQLGTVLRKQDKRGYREGKDKSDLYEATRFTRAFPGQGMNSLTARRQSIPGTLAASGLLGMMGYDQGGELGGVASGLALPASMMAMGRFYNSPAGRRYFGKGLLPPISDAFRRQLGQKVGLGAIAATQPQ